MEGKNLKVLRIMTTTCPPIYGPTSEAKAGFEQVIRECKEILKYEK